jgi:hypothetical protein
LLLENVDLWGPLPSTMTSLTKITNMSEATSTCHAWPPL